MPAYRLYRIDGSGKITAADWIEADDDAAAEARVRETHRSGKIELWQGQRLVDRIELSD